MTEREQEEGYVPNDMQDEQTTEQPEQMTEQIEASFGPMTVYVSGTDAEDVQETFDHVWATMMDTSEKMQEMKTDDDRSGSAFGD